MRCTTALLILTLSVFSTSYGQVDSLTVNNIKDKFKAFQYAEVIAVTEDILSGQQSVAKEHLLEILRLRAISFYSLGDIKSSLSTFIRILENDPDYKLNSQSTAPKIIDFFEEIQANFHQRSGNPQQPGDEAEPKSISGNQTNANLDNNFNSSVLKSMLLPGWGHFARGSTTKGLVIGALGLGSLGSAIYFAVDTHSKEETYLNETNRSLIDSRYDEFNAAFKRRNAFIVAYALIWLYTQVDLLYFTDNTQPAKITSPILPTFRFDNKSNFMVRFSFSM
ncbi:MAG: hypothetical protein GWN00_28075 [Aliifodinibius sp.]|nr:hypothetical protein [Fodinibius sp.]NIW47361.1 hypothetical protein [Gammaproteobacteria bacterium]NIY28520.1 hypothetical protein [Fodinibius sp.]